MCEFSAEETVGQGGVGNGGRGRGGKDTLEEQAWLPYWGSHVGDERCQQRQETGEAPSHQILGPSVHIIRGS